MEIFIGILSGIVSGTGMGGGTVLILLLSMILGLEQHKAQATNLIFFIPTAIVAICANLKNKLIDKKVAIWVSASGIIGALLGAIAYTKTDVNNLRKYFGIFLAIIAIFESISYFNQYIRKNNNHTKNER